MHCNNRGAPQRKATDVVGCCALCTHRGFWSFLFVISSGRSPLGSVA